VIVADFPTLPPHASANAPFELGINYWPRKRAMYMWREFDLGEIRDEMAQIADMGFDSVRWFPLTRDFLPQPNAVDPKMVERMVQVARVVADAGLRSVPTVLVINMSGVIWWPDWMIDANGRHANLYSDPSTLRAQALLAETLAGALAGDESIRAFDVSNEMDECQLPVTSDAGWLWCTVMTEAIRRGAPGVPVQIGAHLASLERENNMRIDDIASVADEDMMHAYPLYSPAARSFLDPELVPFSCALTAGLSGKPRATLMQEFGLCTAPPGVAGHSFPDDFLGQPKMQYLASEEEGAEYYRAVLERLIETGAAGAYAWCYPDYDESLFHRPPLAKTVRERTFGIVRADGSEKPAADVFRKLRRRRDAGELERGEIPRVLDVIAEEYYRTPTAHFKRLYKRWTAGRP
jgi:endo-1,4-beta-mannosidase